MTRSAWKPPQDRRGLLKRVQQVGALSAKGRHFEAMQAFDALPREVRFVFAAVKFAANLGGYAILRRMIRRGDAAKEQQLLEEKP